MEWFPYEKPSAWPRKLIRDLGGNAFNTNTCLAMCTAALATIRLKDDDCHRQMEPAIAKLISDGCQHRDLEKEVRRIAQELGYSRFFDKVWA